MATTHPAEDANATVRELQARARADRQEQAQKNRAGAQGGGPR